MVSGIKLDRINDKEVGLASEDARCVAINASFDTPQPFHGMNVNRNNQFQDMLHSYNAFHSHCSSELG